MGSRLFRAESTFTENGEPVQNLEIAKIDAERKLLLVKGAIPGAKGGQVIVTPAVKARAKKA